MPEKVGKSSSFLSNYEILTLDCCMISFIRANHRYKREDNDKKSPLQMAYFPLATVIFYTIISVLRNLYLPLNPRSRYEQVG